MEGVRRTFLKLLFLGLFFPLISVLQFFIWGISSIKSFFNSEEATSKDLIPVQQQADINIFTVASGLLYEVSYYLWGHFETGADIFNSDLSVS